VNVFAAQQASGAQAPMVDDRQESGLSGRAWFFYLLCAAGAAAGTLPLLPRLENVSEPWFPFVVLAVSAAVAQIFVVITPRNQSYHMTPVFLMPRSCCSRPSCSRSWRS
jgi:hypothetical protein